MRIRIKVHVIKFSAQPMYHSYNVIYILLVGLCDNCNLSFVVIIFIIVIKILDIDYRDNDM